MGYSKTKPLTFVVSVLLLIFMLMMECSVGADEVVAEELESILRPSPPHCADKSELLPTESLRPELQTGPQPGSSNSQSVPRLSVLERDVQEEEVLRRGPYDHETWTEHEETAPLETDPSVLEQKARAAAAQHISIQQIVRNCTFVDFSNVNLLTLLLSCPPLASEISADCCTELVKIERDVSACFCILVQTVLGASLDDIVELPTLLSTCTELSSPCP